MLSRTAERSNASPAFRTTPSLQGPSSPLARHVQPRHGEGFLVVAKIISLGGRNADKSSSGLENQQSCRKINDEDHGDVASAYAPTITIISSVSLSVA
jgi:hypothetical protein